MDWVFIDDEGRAHGRSFGPGEVVFSRCGKVITDMPSRLKREWGEDLCGLCWFPTSSP